MPDTGLPIALLATVGDMSYVGNVVVALNDEERRTFWAAVERLGTSQARLAGLAKRKGSSWLKAGLVARVRHLRDEDMLRHASLQTLDPEDPLPGEVDVERHGKGE